MWPHHSQPRWQPPEPPIELHPQIMRRDIDAIGEQVKEHGRIIATARHYLHIGLIILLLAANLGRDLTLDLLAKLLKVSP